MERGVKQLAQANRQRSRTDRPAAEVKRSKNRNPSAATKSGGGFFDGVYAFFIARGISRKRLQVWTTRFTELGGTVLKSATASPQNCDLIHVLAADETVLSKEVDLNKLKDFQTLRFVQSRWIEDCLKDGQLLSCELYSLFPIPEHGNTTETETRQSIPEISADLRVTAAQTVPDTHVEHVFGSSDVVNQTKSTDTPRDIQESEWETKIGAEGPSCEEGDDDLPADEAPDYNKHVAGPLREMSNIYTDVLSDEWRALTYRKTANKLDKLSYKISSAEELKNIMGIGKSMIEKIKEILCTGQLQKLETLKANPQVQTIQQFASVWGIGPKQAHRLYQAGYKSLEDICQDTSLPSMARIGLKYHYDIILRIPRAEVTEAGAFVQTVLEDLCPGAWLTIGGSYRRGQSTCGDIDLLITHPDGHSHNGLLSTLVAKLQDIKFLCGDSSPRPPQNKSHKVDTFMGICKLPQHSHHRRIDFKIYSKDIYAFALVYFTGNDVLNRRIRYFARTKGFKLSDQGLFRRIGWGAQSVESDVSIQCHSEEEIFEKLGLPYPEPRDRNW